MDLQKSLSIRLQWHRGVNAANPSRGRHRYPIFGVFDDFTSMDDLTSSDQNTDQIWRFQTLMSC